MEFVSLILPVRNEERYIERCLESIARQHYARADFEVIVVDGRSTDATREIVQRFATESSLDLRLLDNPKMKPAAAMNIGLDAARGNVIIRIDGHARIAPDYVRRCIEALAQTGADCVGGVLTSEGEGLVGEAIAAAMSSRFGVGDAAFRVGGEGPADTVAFGAYRSEVFDRIGRYAEDIDRGEDDEFNYRLRDAGGSIVLVPSIRAAYTVRGDLPGLWRQYFGYGKAKPRVLRLHPAQARPRQFVPAAFVGALGLSLIAAIFGRSGPCKALVTVYTLAATIASLVLARRHRGRHLPLLPAVFGCLHLSYGLGFLFGVMGTAGKQPAGIIGRNRRQDDAGGQGS